MNSLNRFGMSENDKMSSLGQFIYIYMDELNSVFRMSDADKGELFSSLLGSSFEATCRQSIAPIVAAARCLVSVMGRQRLQRIAGRR